MFLIIFPVAVNIHRKSLNNQAKLELPYLYFCMLRYCPKCTGKHSHENLGELRAKRLINGGK